MKKNVILIILILIIIVLSSVLIYGVYTEFKVKAVINSLQLENQQLNAEKENLTVQLNALAIKYGMLQDDVFQLKKSCITQNICWGHFPGVRWYCNNVGDAVNNPSHICVCDSNCNLNATQIS
jgi:cell division protein FtsL